MSQHFYTTSEHPPPPYQEVMSENEKQTLDEKSGASIEDTASTTSEDTDAFDLSGGKTLLIDAPGLTCRLFKPGTLETNISNADGSPAYISTRHSRTSGDCILSHHKHGDLLSTHYKFGPGRPPQVQYLDMSSGSNTEGITINSKVTSRSVDFVAHDGKSFEWSYAKDKATKSNLIVLTEKYSDAPKNRQRAALAMLVRNDATRPAGSSKWTSGNGGELVIQNQAAHTIDEPLIIATCLVMLKKEIDRRKGAAASAGMVVLS